MKVEQLRQMVELASTRSMNQAAANLFMSQPNLSISIRKLEEELGCALVVRSSRGITLTTRGERFVEQAESILYQFDNLRAACQPYGNKALPSLSLAIANCRYVVHAAAALQQQHQTSPYNQVIHETDREGAWDYVTRGDCELGVINILNCHKKDVLRQMKTKDIQYYRLGASPTSILVGKGSPLYYLPEDAKLSMDQLSRFPQVRYEKMDFGRFGDREQLLGIPKPPSEIVVDSRAALFEILNATDAYTISSTNHSAYRHTEYYPSTRSFSLEDSNLLCEVGWIKRSSTTPSPLALEFVQLLTGYFE